MALGGACCGIYYCVSGLYFFNGRTARLASTTLSVAVLGVPLSAALVFNFGVQGAAMGFALTQALMALGAATMAWHTFTTLPWRAPGSALSTWMRRVLNVRDSRPA